MSDAPFYTFHARSIDRQDVDFAQYQGKVVLVVNVASRCGFTGQYAGLEALYKKYQDQGLVILGFPCDQFGNQEPGTEEEIKSFCSLTYDVSFPMFAKIEVNGPNANALYKYLRSEAPSTLTAQTPGAERLWGHLEKNFPELLEGDAVKWNFTKFLVGRDGKVLQRFESPETPEAIDATVAAALAAK